MAADRVTESLANSRVPAVEYFATRSAAASSVNGGANAGQRAAQNQATRWSAVRDGGHGMSAAGRARSGGLVRDEALWPVGADRGRSGQAPALAARERLWLRR